LKASSGETTNEVPDTRQPFILKQALQCKQSAQS